MDTRKYLVIACGQDIQHCKNHPSERWVSVDPQETLKPDIVKTLESLKASDFSHKFEVVFVEGITGGFSVTRLDTLNSLLESDGILLVYPTSLSCLENAENLENFNLTYFILCDNFLILVKNNGNLDNICQIYKNDLCNKYSEEIKNKINSQIDLFLNETKKIQNKYKDLHPNLVSFLAHVSIYLIQRTNRRFYNLFQNKNYAQFQVDIEEKILQFSKRDIHKDLLLRTMQEWKIKLPSTSVPDYKLPTGYIKLDNLIAQLSTLINFYDNLRLKQKTAKAKCLSL